MATGKTLLELVLAHDPIPPTVDEPVHCSLSQMVRRLDAWLGAERVTFMKVRRGEWEARTYSGVVGRGHTLTDAVAELLAQTGEVAEAA